MAQIDFSNATIEPVSTKKPFSQYKLGLGIVNNFNTYFRDVDGNNLLSVNYLAPTILANTPTRMSLIYTGTIASGIASGTAFYLGLTGGAAYNFWKVSHISYSAGDTFSFQLDFDITIS